MSVVSITEPVGSTGAIFSKEAFGIFRVKPDYQTVLRMDLGQRRLLSKVLGAPIPCDCLMCRSADVAKFGYFSSYWDSGGD